MSGASADRPRDGGRIALVALAAIVVITALWWTLALWPAATSSTGWLARTREVCFGAAPGGLPDAGGWILLIGEPIGLIGILVAVWGRPLAAGLRAAASTWTGRVALGVTTAAMLFGARLAAEVVAEAKGLPFEVRSEPTSEEILAGARANDSAPALVLTDQYGDEIALAGLRGRPIVVTFGYGHCATVCPVTVRAARLAVERAADQRPVLLVVTLDPWRDTPARLPTVAEGWKLTAPGMHLLGGEVERVEAALTAWRIPRVRNGRTGEVSHPAVVYVLDPAGRIRFALGAETEAITAAIQTFPATPIS